MGLSGDGCTMFSTDALRIESTLSTAPVLALLDCVLGDSQEASQLGVEALRQERGSATVKTCLIQRLPKV